MMTTVHDCMNISHSDVHFAGVLYEVELHTCVQHEITVINNVPQEQHAQTMKKAVKMMMDHSLAVYCQ